MMGWAREREADEKIYLDADAVENCFGCWVDKYGYGHEPDEMDEFNRILALPAADVVEAIRCKDCLHWIPGYITDQDDFVPPKCGKYEQMVGHSGDDFCSLAERRQDG